MKQFATILALWATLATIGHAHPSGHDKGLLEAACHIVTQPDHLLLLAASLSMLGFVLVKQLRSAKK
ncbi:MAG: hypothetical protein ACPGGN_05315 [Opitutales bacterium]